MLPSFLSIFSVVASALLALLVHSKSSCFNERLWFYCNLLAVLKVSFPSVKRVNSVVENNEYFHSS